MTVWLVAAVVLLVALVPLVYVMLRADTMSRLVAFEAVVVDTTLTLLVLAKYFDRSFYADEAVVLAVLSLGGGFAFARVLERWL